jgi:hypothetical protein
MWQFTSLNPELPTFQQIALVPPSYLAPIRTSSPFQMMPMRAMYRWPKIIYPILRLCIDDGRDPGALGKWKWSAQLVFFWAVKSDLNNVWMTKNNPHRPCLTKKGSTLWSEYKSSLSSTGDWKWSTTSTDVWKWSTPSNRSIAMVTMLSRLLCPGN